MRRAGLYIVLMMAVGSSIWAEDATSDSKMTKVEEAALGQLEALKEACGVFKEAEDGEQLVMALKPHAALFKGFGLDAVNKWSSQKCEGMMKGLKKIANEIKTSIKYRELLLKSTSQKSFARKALSLAQKGTDDRQQKAKMMIFGGGNGGGIRWKEFEEMEKDEFRNAKKDMLKNWQWSLEVDESEKDLIWNDDFTGQDKTCSFSGKMAVEGGAGGGFGQMFAAAIQVGVARDGNQQKSLSEQLGLKVNSLDDEARASTKLSGGVIVSKVAPDGLADAAGLKKGDVVTKVAKKPVVDAAGFKKMLLELEDEESFVLTYVRDGKEKTVTIEHEAPAAGGVKADADLAE